MGLKADLVDGSHFIVTILLLGHTSYTYDLAWYHHLAVAWAAILIALEMAKIFAGNKEKLHKLTGGKQ